MSNLATFYIIRHGQTDWNKAHKLQGHTDIPLNETGEQQAKELAKMLNHVQFDLAFSSDLLRAKKTAEIIILEKNLHVAAVKTLRECSFGKHEGNHSSVLTEYFKLVKGLSDAERRKHRMDDNIENDEEVMSRLITFLRETAISHPDKKILIVTHGVMLRMFMLHIGYITYKQADTMFMTNGGFVKVESDGVDFFIKEVSGFVPREQKS